MKHLIPFSNKLITNQSYAAFDKNNPVSFSLMISHHVEKEFLKQQ